MAIAIIENWLNDAHRSYEQGLQLYEQYGDNSLVKSLLRKGHSGSHYHFTRLTDALRSLKVNVSVEPPVIYKAADILAKLPKLDDIHVSVKRYSVSDEQWIHLPEQIKDLYTRQSRLHAHSQMLFNQSRITESPADRLILDRQILLERNEMNMNWKTIKDFHANGAEKEDLQKAKAVDIEKLSIAELVKLNSNIPPSLSKKRTRLKTLPDGSTKNKLINKIMELEVLQDLVKKKLSTK